MKLWNQLVNFKSTSHKPLYKPINKKHLQCFRETYYVKTVVKFETYVSSKHLPKLSVFNWLTMDFCRILISVTQ